MAKPEILSAVTTPFDKAGDVHLDAFMANLQRLEPYADGIFVAGTTGEFLALAPAEHLNLVTSALQVFGPSRTIVHVGSASLRQALRLADAAASAGAQRFSALTPLYHAASPRGTGDFYASLKTCLGEHELYAYLFPDVANTNIEPHQLTPLIDAGVSGLKLSGSAASRIDTYMEHVPTEISVWSGNDADLPRTMKVGGRGTVSGVSSVCPRPWAEFRNAYQQADEPTLLSAQARIEKLVSLLGPSIANIKFGLAVIGHSPETSGCRMTIDPPDLATREAISQAIETEFV